MSKFTFCFLPVKHRCLTATKQAGKILLVKLVTVSEAAREKGISREAIYRAIQDGRLRYRKILGKIGIVRSSLESYEPDGDKIRAGLTGARSRKRNHRIRKGRNNG
jgi:excisionase family DNA binding protein